MDCKVVISDEALSDLQEIVEYIAEDSPASAERVGNQLLDRCDVLRRFPESGPRVLGFANVRKLTEAPYQIYYSVDRRRSVVNILHFWHGSRRPPKLPTPPKLR